MINSNPDDNIASDTDDNAIDHRKCYNCGKIFRVPALLQRHKQRLTPCIIREIPQEQLGNPNRCIYCNKIFSNKGNLRKHHGACKIKNGGMHILVDKVKYEQKIKALEDINKQTNDEITMLKERERQMREDINQLKDTLKQLTLQPPAASSITTANINITNNNVVNVTNTTNITINSYLHPQYTHMLEDKARPFIELFKEKGVGMPMALIPIIWFNPKTPENLSIYLVNKSTKEVLVYDQGAWISKSFESVSSEIRDIVYKLSVCVCDHARKSLHEHYGFAIDNMRDNWHNTDVIADEYKHIFEELTRGRQLVKPHVLT
jgi:hypothetical protein